MSGFIIFSTDASVKPLICSFMACMWLSLSSDIVLSLDFHFLVNITWW